MEHVLEFEVKAIWEKLRVGDVLVFYQHQTNRAGKPWVEAKKKQLAHTLGVKDESLKMAKGSIAKDVVFFYCGKVALKTN
jgi:hypothetical protein